MAIDTNKPTTMDLEEMRNLIFEHRVLKDEIREKQGLLCHKEHMIKAELVKHQFSECLKVDWTMLRRRMSALT